MKPTDTACADLERFIREHIPLARQMDVRLQQTAAGVVAARAPLAPNVNDKGCAFGGSLVSVMTLAGWALAELTLRRHRLDCDVFVADSQVRYLAPVWSDFEALARPATAESLRDFVASVTARGRGRLPVRVEVATGDGAATTLEARFAARRRGD